uniref:Uncharacterized protein n=1 Tax=Abalone asfa-like virus TaxID=2839893 RepID=A0A5K7Y0Z7_9VIRU|nr:hypothetical protein [Abalone asfa-like virus]BCY04632.1 hypothetical protein [Abalone asfa-like virus]
MFDQDNLQLTLLAYKPEELTSQPAYRDELQNNDFIGGAEDEDVYYKSFAEVMSTYMDNINILSNEKRGGNEAADLFLMDLDEFYDDSDEEFISHDKSKHVIFNDEVEEKYFNKDDKIDVTTKSSKKQKFNKNDDLDDEDDDIEDESARDDPFMPLNFDESSINILELLNINSQDDSDEDTNQGPIEHEYHTFELDEF